MSEVAELFDSSVGRSCLKIGNRTVLVDPAKSISAKVFTGVSETEVKAFFSELTGKPLNKAPVINIPGKGIVYNVETPDGSFNLRNFSTSSTGSSGVTWTKDVPKSLSGGSTPEMKFDP